MLLKEYDGSHLTMQRSELTKGCVPLGTNQQQLGLKCIQQLLHMQWHSMPCTCSGTGTLPIRHYAQACTMLGSAVAAMHTANRLCRMQGLRGHPIMPPSMPSKDIYMQPMQTQ